MPAESGRLPVGGNVRVFDLEQPRTVDMPVHESHRPGYFYALHRRHEDGYRPDEGSPRSGASGLIVCKEHSGTHIDALSHQADALTLRRSTCGRRPDPVRIHPARRRGDSPDRRPRSSARRPGASGGR